MPSTGTTHPYDTRYKNKIRPSLKVQKRKAAVKKASKKKGRGSRRPDDAQITQEPIEIVSDVPSPSLSSLGDNIASSEGNNGEIANDVEVEVEVEPEVEPEVEVEPEPEVEPEVEAGALAEQGAEDPATSFDNPQPVDYGYAPEYIPQVNAVFGFLY